MSNKNLNHFFSAARTALSNSKHGEISQWIGTGPSIRARARLALIAAFLVAAPTLFVGVMRTEEVATYAKTLGIYDSFGRKISNARVSIENVRVGVWRYEALPELENERLLLKSSESLKMEIQELVSEKPKELDYNLTAELNEMAIKVEDSIGHGLKRRKLLEEGSSDQAMNMAKLALMTLSSDVQNLETRVNEMIRSRRQEAISALSRVGRDQLILFLVLLFAIPIFVGFAPRWLVAPLLRLKRIEQRIEEGRIRDLAVSGRDEISRLARAIKNALVWREELDQRKSAKIFEIRNVLRAVIAHVSEPVLIIDRAGRINYANEAASNLIDIEIHHLEGHGLHEFIFAPELEMAIKKAQDGDVNEAGMTVSIELRDGRSEHMLAHFSAVHDRQGGVSRVVLVLLKQDEEGVEKT